MACLPSVRRGEISVNFWDPFRYTRRMEDTYQKSLLDDLLGRISDIFWDQSEMVEAILTCLLESDVVSLEEVAQGIGARLETGWDGGKVLVLDREYYDSAPNEYGCGYSRIIDDTGTIYPDHPIRWVKLTWQDGAWHEEGSAPLVEYTEMTPIV
jgi:hypothetical protein